MSENPYLPDDLDAAELSSRAASPARRGGCLPLNFLTFVFLLLTALYLVYCGILLVNPYVAINPFPPRTPLPVYVVATLNPNPPTITPTPSKVPDTPAFNTLAPTATASATVFFSPTPSTTPTQVLVEPPAVSPQPEATLTPVLFGDTGSGVDAGAGTGPADGPVEAALTPPPPGDSTLFTPSDEPFTLYRDTVTYLENPGEQACQWAAIAGTATGLGGEPLPGLAVQVVGEGIDWISFTGTAPLYGAGGYEVYLSDAPLAGLFTAQLLDQSGTPISAAFSVETRATCEENIAVVSFVQNHDF